MKAIPLSPLLVLTKISRCYAAGEQTITALKSISLTIYAGQMVALVGPSGSGKSTLLNILGCLDRPTLGQYRLNGEEISKLNPDRLAYLRQKYFGFIFQRYQLITNQTALNNVALPAIYAGLSQQARQQRAESLLTTLGLGDRTRALPSELSGGQQQRVSIARALMNGGVVILADEPTGALDSQTGAEVMSVLQDLRLQGHTVIVVTHDPAVAACADRIVQLRDGEIVSDSIQPSAPAPIVISSSTPAAGLQRRGRIVADAVGIAWTAIRCQAIRALLTALGIVIGITAVACMVGLGQGAREKVVSDIKAMGYNTFTVYPGSGWGDKEAASLRTLTVEDANLIGEMTGITSVSPLVYAFPTLQRGSRQAQAQLTGINERYLSMADRAVQTGRSLTAEDIAFHRPVVVIDKNVQHSLFAVDEDPIGTTIKIDHFMATVVGVSENDNFLRTSASYMPWNALLSRQTTRQNIDAIIFKVQDGANKIRLQHQIEMLLTLRHNGKKDFFIHSAEDISRAVERSTATLTLLILSITAIALLIGGIGIMNMMLVSVTERTHEIGIRLALGATQRDILLQFLCEALIICLASGFAGVVLSWIISLMAPRLFNEIPLIFSSLSVAIAVACSTATGLIFGYLPARHAANLDPIAALARD
ncbi:ABC transporter permease [Brucella pituitosa]|uniref:Pyoverdine export ATP-binding/permease protein PvdT n=1 Tax=Brucella pituitosa TaxID=571256 RepID=A0ABS3K5Y1_9HYPH|nr:ABC transporter permease [Brucella pituitosa]MBO1042289.1 ABC transporter permease [Brucella pituitosa]